MQTEAQKPVSSPADAEPEPARPAGLPKEIGGVKGPDPTRYGDWERNGRCIDF
jgi:hypothetical protein